jgi:hypothetical protein
MIKKIVYLAILIIPAFAFMDVLSNGAPAESTGAPAEPNCTKSGCHQDFSANSGTGTPDLVVAGGASSYVPGVTYDLTASINQTGINTFGFQVLALADRDSSNVGTLVVTEGGRTQIISGFGSLTARQYITLFPERQLLLLGMINGLLNGLHLHQMLGRLHSIWQQSLPTGMVPIWETIVI